MNRFVYILLFVFAVITQSIVAIEPNTVNRKAPAAISGKIEGSATVCQNASKPTVTFTGSGGNNPYKFVYQIDGGVEQNVSTSSGSDKVTIEVPTDKAGSFVYKLIKVSDDKNEIALSEQITVTIIALPTISGSLKACLGSNLQLTGSGTAAPILPWKSLNPSVATISNTGLVTPVSSGNSTIIYKNSNGCEVTAVLVVNDLPLADFTFEDNQCSGSDIQFNSTVTGTGKYTYYWNFGDGSTSTDANPTHKFTTFGCNTKPYNVNLIVTDDNGCSSTIKTRTITIKQQPNISFTDLNNPFDPFNNCSNASSAKPSFSIKIENTSVSKTCISSYTIDWGDGSPQIPNAVFPLEHTYNQLGAYNLTVTAFGTNGCNSTKLYVVKNVTNPSGGIISPGTTTNLCAPTPELNFEIAKWGANSPGTTYTVDFGDNSAVLKFTQEQLVASKYYSSTDPVSSANYPIPHSYTSSNCPNNQYTAVLTVTSACNSTSFTANNITILTKPKADFNVSSMSCVNSSVLFTNTTIVGYSPNCNSKSNFTWDFGDGTPVETMLQSDLTNTTHTYTVPGIYSVTLTADNYCGKTSITKQITINPLPTATISGSDTICQNTLPAPLITFTGANGVEPYTFTYKINGGVNQTVKTITGNSVTISAPTTATGTFTYTLVSVQEGSTAQCSQLQTDTAVVKVNPLSTATISGTKGVCLGDSPATIIFTGANGTAPYTFTYNINNGASQTKTTTKGDTVSVSVPATTAGAFKYNLMSVQDASTTRCIQTQVGSATITVNQIPTVDDIPSQSKCNGDMSDAINFTGSVPNTVYNWTNDNASIGLAASNKGNISSFKFINTGGTIKIAKITVTPTYTNAGVTCTGVAKTFTFTVNPAPSITKQPVSSAVCKDGTAAPLAVEYINGIGKATFQWYSNQTNSNVGGTKISSTDSVFIPPTSAVGTLYYYCVVTLNMGGCSILTSNAASVVVTEVPVIKNQPLALQSVCVGGTLKAPLTMSYTGGAGTVGYQWFENTTNTNTGGTPIVGATNINFTPPAFTTVGKYYYYAEVSFNASGCAKIVSDTVRVDVIADPIINTQPLTTQTLCQGATPVSLTVAASGGIGIFAYQWYSNTLDSNTGGALLSGSNDSIFTPSTLTVGTKYYYCVVSQPNGPGCTVSSSVATVIVNAAPVFTSQPISSAVCLNGIPTTLSVAYANGVGTPKYQWYQNSVNNNSSGTSILGETNPTFNPPTNKVDTVFYYCVITLPSGGCSQITSDVATVAVTEIPAITTHPVPTQSVCIGGTIPTPLTLTYSGGAGVASCQWYANTANSNVGGTKISNGTTFKYTPPAFSVVGSYYFYAEITFTGNACTSVLSDVAEIKVVPDPIVTTQPLSTQTLCQGAVPAILTVAGNGGLGEFSYQWYSRLPFESGLGTLIVGATKDTFSPPTLTVGTTNYYCILSQPNGAGCNATSAMATVIVNVAPYISEQPASSTVCLGSVPTKLSVHYKNRIGLPSYQWYSNTVKSIAGSVLITAATDSTYAPPALVADTMYYYCIINLPAGGCGNLTSDIATVIVNPYPVIKGFKSLIASDESFSIVPKNVDGDIVPIGTTYTWKTPTVSPLNSISGATAQTIPQSTISQLLKNNTTAQATVKYIVTPTFGICVGADFEVIVTVNPPLNPNVIVSDISCFGLTDGSFSTNIQGGIPPYTVGWTGPNGFTSDKTAISGLEKGDYMLNITDKSSMGFMMSLKIAEPSDIVLQTDYKRDVTCKGAANGEIGIIATGGVGGFKYSWTKDNVAFSNLEDITGLSPGDYNVTVTDANNCNPKSLSFSITEPEKLVVSLIDKTDNICNGDSLGAINVEVNGGTTLEISAGVFDYKYAWTGANGFSSNTQNLKGLKSGKYTLTVTDKNNCTNTLVVTITEPEMIVITPTTTPIACYGANNATLKLDITGGVKPYKVTWDNFASGEYKDNLSAGDYIITVTDVNNCAKTIKVNIPEAPIFRVTPIVKNVSCYGAKDGSIALNFEGGKKPISFAWTDGSTYGTTRNNIGPGTYTVNISDASSCSISRTFTITEPQPLRLSAVVTNALSCDTANGGAINLQVTGGTLPYVYSWSNGATTEDLVNLQAGNYIVTVTDSNNCSQTMNYTVARPLPISINVTAKANYNCTTKYLKEICTATITGGLPPYNLVWSRGAVSGLAGEIMETNQSGIVILDVTDKLGCTARNTIDLLLPIPGIDYQLIDCDTRSYIFKAVIPEGMSIDYTYLWDFGDGVTDVLQNTQHKFTSPGTYKVTLTLKNKTCTSVFEEYVVVEGQPVLKLDKLPIYCAGDSLLLHVSGAATYRWNNGAVGDSLMIKQTGDYAVTGTSKAGCTSTLNFTATNFKPYNYTLQTDRNEVTTENPDLQLWTEGIMYSEYFWNFGDSLSAEGNNQSHSYKIKKGGYYDVKLRVKNPNGCNEFATKRIWINDDSANNTFTPNGDGVDDVFLQGWHVQIYNRNGILLYDGTSGWDGTYKGSPVANDTYFYVEYISTLDGVKSKTGFVTVIR